MNRTFGVTTNVRKDWDIFSRRFLRIHIDGRTYNYGEACAFARSRRIPMSQIEQAFRATSINQLRSE